MNDSFFLPPDLEQYEGVQGHGQGHPNKTFPLDLRAHGKYGLGLSLPGVGEDTPGWTPFLGAVIGDAKMDNMSDNISATVDLLERMGPRRQELYKVIPITVVYCLIFITGIVGNISTCVVIARNKYMQTATNYYLFNLAVADLLVLILGLPQETYSFWSAYPWIFGETFCVVRTMAAETSTYASILTITAFTVERYVAICHPMKAQTMSSLQRAIKVIIIIWVASGICSIPMVIQFGIVYLKDHYGQAILQSATCNIRPDRYLEHTFEVSTFLFFFTPMTIITVLYLLIGLAIRRSTLSRAGSDSSTHSGQTGTELRAQQQARARRAVLKMLVAVVVAFFICWAPFHTQRLLVMYLKTDDWTPALVGALYYVSGVLYYVSAVINPILYNIMSLKFRQAFKHTLVRPCKHKHKKRTIAKCKTYRFNQKPLLTDTNLTLIHLHLNGYTTGDIIKFRNHRYNQKYGAGRSNSSSVSGCSSPRLGPGDDPFDNMELEQVLADGKSNHSYHHHHQHQRTPSANNLNRPYHSFA